MKKILLGLAALVVVAVGGFFGFDLYVQHRVVRGVEDAFEQVRTQGGKASHGRISFDLLKRTLSIGDIALESATQPPFRIKASNVMAHGVNASDTARFSAESIEANDVEVSATISGQQTVLIAYKAPQVTVKDYSGPAGQSQLPASSSPVDLYRFGLQRLASVTASSITAPTVTAAMTFDVAKPGAGEGALTYSGIAIENMKDGKIASSKVDKAAFTINAQPAGKPITTTGYIADIVTTDIDVGAMAAIFDPAKASDDRDYRIQGHVSAGPYELTTTTTPPLSMRIDGVTTDNISINPSRMQLPALLAMIPPPGSPPPSPAQARELLEKIAGLYSGIGIGNAEMHGLSFETPQGPFKLASMRLNLEHGKIGELAAEGFDGRSPNGPFKLGRFALKSLDIASFMRLTAQFAGQKPTPEQALALFPLIEGAEVKGLVAPYKNTGKPLSIDVLSLDWGQFVGTIPSRLHLVAKLSGPLDAADATQQALVAAGLNRITVDADLGAAWTEASHAFALEPVKFEIGGLADAQARLSLANVPREAFSLTPQSMAVAGQIEAGPIEFTLRDLGGVDIAVANYARTQNVGRDEARAAILDSIKAQGAPLGADNPDIAALIAAIGRFVETPGQTLVIKLTPRAKAPALQLMQLLKTDPPSALAQFKIEASTGL
ncbi:hypothetical protein IC762_16100 [Bradyrhizobium genosp. L]|uniref:hypothetical protein n=1 Tax=Bradyrhizobium genosp. L TaxID=83637 RepID=UPI0018A2C84D|nr:hypothetical protein [Bradyrhizobium genosp. L]QPF87717.1 hypothetical protein IC762_16100 [Bradyrhizobium genosp. L]